MRKNYYLTKIIAFIITGCSDEKRHLANLKRNIVPVALQLKKIYIIKLAPQTINRYLESGLLLIHKFKVGSGICLRTFYKVGLKVFQND